MNRFRQEASSSRRLNAFTLIELLVVVGVIAILASTILPALSKAKQRSIQTHCMSNLKQIGIAMQLYVNDNDDFLPGPVWSGARASYDRDTSKEELIYYIADYLDAPNPLTVSPNKPVIAEVFVCPGYVRSAPDFSSMMGRKCYLLKDNVNDDPDPAKRVPPFGYPGQDDHTPPVPAILQLKMSQLETYTSSANTYAMTDVDKINVPPVTTGSISNSWWITLPDRPVHGDARAELYFDWHVGVKRVDF